MSPTSIDALMTSRIAPTPSASISRATPPLTTERGDTMIQPSQCSAPTAMRPRLRKRPPGRSPRGGRGSAQSLVLEFPLRTGKLIVAKQVQDGGQNRVIRDAQHLARR